MKTIQLRRYTLIPAETGAFLQWWRDRVVPVRRRAGFTIEFAYLDAVAGEFVWAVSAPGKADDFRALEQVYMESEERAAVFRDVPQRVISSHIALVTPVEAAPG